MGEGGHAALISSYNDICVERKLCPPLVRSAATGQQVNGLVQLRSEYVTKRVGPAFCRGLKVTLTFDEEKYVGAGLYLFASILERFLGEYVSINSFTILSVETLQRKEKLKQWPARNGQRQLL